MASHAAETAHPLEAAGVTASAFVDNKTEATSEIRSGLRTMHPALELEDHPINQTRPLKAIVVGAGIAGITAGILLPKKVPGLELKILERHSDVVSRLSQRTL